MLRLIGKASSINMRKVLWTCAELKIDFRHDELTGRSETENATDLKALNPNQLVPVLIDDELVLWESNTIIRYLAGAFGGGHLLPEEPKVRASIEMWIDWQAAELNPAWSYAFHSIVRKSPAYADRELIEGSLKRWAQKMDILEGQLQSTGKFVAGSRFTLADIPIGLSVNRWFLTPGTHHRHPAISAYYDRLAERSAFMEYGRNGTA